jgi:hypothetical protein
MGRVYYAEIKQDCEVQRTRRGEPLCKEKDAGTNSSSLDRLELWFWLAIYVPY